jgi:DAACS family dicarboxylate/amino acid:cation (Na+ or H+) symporter
MFASMTLGITNIPDKGKLGRVGMTALFLYALTTLIAIGLGIGISSWLELGSGLHLAQSQPVETKGLPSIAELITSIVPKNPIHAFAEGAVLQILVFSTFFGISLNLAGEKAKPIISCLESLATVMLRMTGFVMKLSPIGVFALMAWTTGSFGLDVLVPVLQFLVSYWVAALVFILVVYCTILRVFAKLKPMPFFKSMTSVMATAASTCSSSASLPITMQTAEEKLGISKSLSNFVLPLGCSLNMNGSALFQSMSAIFIAQSYGIELQAQHLFALVATVLMATLGTASVPGGGLLMLSLVFTSVGIPLEGLAILAGIDRLRDMATTTLNITGDAVCAVYVAKKENELDESIYYKTELSPAAQVNV